MFYSKLSTSSMKWKSSPNISTTELWTQAPELFQRIHKTYTTQKTVNVEVFSWGSFSLLLKFWFGIDHEIFHAWKWPPWHLYRNFNGMMNIAPKWTAKSTFSKNFPWQKTTTFTVLDLPWIASECSMVKGVEAIIVGNGQVCMVF